MIAEIVSNGMLSLPSALAVVGTNNSLHSSFYRTITLPFRYCPWGYLGGWHLWAVTSDDSLSPRPQIVFLGIFGLFTAKILIDFKLNHPNVHNM